MAYRKRPKRAPREKYEPAPVPELDLNTLKPSGLEKLAYDAKVIARTAQEDPLAALTLIEGYGGDKAPLYTAVAIYATWKGELAEEKEPRTATLWNRVAEYAMSKSVLAPNGPGRRRRRF